jgi:competence protein ComEA
MAEFPDLPPRPLPPRRLGDSIRAWLAWFGLGRLIATACCTVIVVAGAYWLLRAPAPPAEATIPFASSGGAAATAVTLPPPPGTTAGVEQTSVVVHVAGAVRSPGVYTLGTDDRVHDAVSAAGGASSDADLAGLNLAAPLADGARIYVPLVGEIDPATVPSGVSPSSADAAVTQPIDLNRATAAEFEALPGVGPATAAAIVGDRDRNGPFASVDDLDRVPGIGPAKLAALRDLVAV